MLIIFFYVLRKHFNSYIKTIKDYKCVRYWNYIRGCITEKNLEFLVEYYNNEEEEMVDNVFEEDDDD